MGVSQLGTQRHPKFTLALEELTRQIPHATIIINAAIWEIERNPTLIGFRIEELDIWAARLEVPAVVLLFDLKRRLVKMLAIMATDDFQRSGFAPAPRSPR